MSYPYNNVLRVIASLSGSSKDAIATEHAGRIEPATLISILNIGHFVDPKRNKPDNFENFIDDS